MAKAATTSKKAPKTRFDDKARYDQVRVGNLVVDHRVQRDHLNKSKLNAMREEFQPLGLNTILVSERDDGEMVIIDGQHRWTIAAEMLGEDFLMDCKVFTGLSLAEEAELFVLTNKNQQPANALDLHKANVTRGDEVSIAIERAALSQGWVVGSGRRSGEGPGYIAAVKVLAEIYHLGEDWYEGHGPALVEDTLTVVTQAWGHDDPKAVNQYVLKAVGTFIYAVRKYVDETDRGDEYFDLEWLASRMKARLTKGGAKGWIEAMRSIVDGSNWTLQQAMRHSLYDTYNHGKRARKLPAALRP